MRWTEPRNSTGKGRGPTYVPLRLASRPPDIVLVAPDRRFLVWPETVREPFAGRGLIGLERLSSADAPSDAAKGDAPKADAPKPEEGDIPGTTPAKGDK